MSAKSFSNILHTVVPAPAVIEAGERVQWHEESLCMVCSGVAVHVVSDCLGWPTGTYLIRVDPEFAELVLLGDKEKATGCAFKSIRFNQLEVETAKKISMW